MSCNPDSRPIGAAPGPLILNPLYWIGLWLAVVWMAPGAIQFVDRPIQKWGVHQADVDDAHTAGQQPSLQFTNQGR